MTMHKALFAVLCTSAILAPGAARAGEIRNREVRQETRIYQGVRSDQLTGREYDSLQRQETRLNDERTDDLQRNDGHLTWRQDARLNRQENRLSQEIYRDKHNSRTNPH